MDLLKEIKKSFSAIEKLFSETSIIEFRKCSLNDLYNYHFGLGTHIRNHLLTENSELLHCFQKYNIFQKDDMSFFIICLFYIYEQMKQENNLKKRL